MAIKSLQHSSITDNIFYRSLLAGNAAFEPSDEDILAEQVLSSSAASVTFSGLDAYAADYEHLQLRIANKSTVNSYDNYTLLRFNGSSATSRYHNLVGDGSSVSSNTNSHAGLTCNWHLGSFTGSTDMFGASVIDILEPFSTSKNTTIRDLSGRVRPSYNQVVLSSAFWDSTAAISSIQLVSAFGDYVTGSTFTLIGLK